MARQGWSRVLALACLALVLNGWWPLPQVCAQTPANLQSPVDEGRPAGVQPLKLSDREREWLLRHPVIRVVQDPGWPPIEFADSQGRPQGISNDYLHLLEQRLGIKFTRVAGLSWQQAYARLQRRDLDMTTSVTVTPERQKFWAFTKPYMNIPIVILAHSDVTYVGSMRQLEGKKVAVVDGYAICDWLAADYPGVEMVKVKTTREGIHRLQAREVFAFIDNMLVIGYYLAQLKIINLKIAGDTPYVNAQSMAVRQDWGPLVGILQKGLDSIDERQKRDIYNKWVPIQYDHGFDYHLLWQILAVFLVIFVLLALWNRRLSREIRLRKIVEADLRASEQRFRQLFNVAPIALGIVSTKGDLKEVNQRFSNTFGFNLQEVPNLEEWWRRIYPDPEYRRRMQSTWQNDMRRAITENIDLEPVESRMTRKDGGVLTVLTSGTVLDQDFLYVFYDITERKRAEEALRQSEEKFYLIFKQAPLMAAISGLADGTILEINDMFLEKTGYALEEVLGKSSLRLGWIQSRDREKMIQALREQGLVAGMEITCFAKDGSPVHCLFHCGTVNIGSEKRLLTMALDISEHKRAEEEKAKLEAQLRQSQKMEAVGTLAGGIAHDFNNILGTIIGFAEMALASVRGGKDNSSELGEIVAAGERAKALVSQILTFSRKMEVELKPLDLNREIRQVAALLERTLPKMISIETRLTSQVKTVRANPNQMEQILLNLATNARDVMPEGGRLVIETQYLDLDQEYCQRHLGMEAGAYFLLQVSDTGPGMDQPTQEHIFEPFFTTKGVGQGTGLGLSSVYGIVKAHGGHISCYSEPGLGATFKILLPVSQGEAVPPPQEATLPAAALGGHERILLVDDEQSLRYLGARALSTAGYQVETAASGEEALQLLGEDQAGFDLIIMDLGMPGMGGHKALRAILEQRPQSRIIIASGYAAGGQVDGSLDSGAMGYVAKPFRVAELLATVRKVLDAA